MIRPRSPLVLLGAFLALGGCVVTTAATDGGSGHTVEARRRWEAQRLDDYRITVSRTCFCTEEYRQPARVEVRGDRVVRVTSVETGRELDPRVGVTVEELFDRIARAEDAADEVSAEFHPRHGYPVRATIGTLANDAGTAYFLGDLEPLR